MSEFYSFAGEHYIILFVMAWLVIAFLRCLFRRLCSTIKVACRGWPPSHLDADGDWKPEPEAEES